MRPTVVILNKVLWFVLVPEGKLYVACVVDFVCAQTGFSMIVFACANVSILKKNTNTIISSERKRNDMENDALTLFEKTVAAQVATK